MRVTGLAPRLTRTGLVCAFTVAGSAGVLSSCSQTGGPANPNGLAFVASFPFGGSKACTPVPGQEVTVGVVLYGGLSPYLVTWTRDGFVDTTDRETSTPTSFLDNGKHEKGELYTITLVPHSASETLGMKAVDAERDYFTASSFFGPGNPCEAKTS